MSKPSFTFCFKMVVEYVRIWNLLRYKSGLWIFNKIFTLFLLFRPHCSNLPDIFQPSLKPLYNQIRRDFVQIYMANTYQDHSHFTDKFVRSSCSSLPGKPPPSLKPPFTLESKYSWILYSVIFSIKWRPIPPLCQQVRGCNRRTFGDCFSLNLHPNEGHQMETYSATMPGSSRLQWEDIRLQFAPELGPFR